MHVDKYIEQGIRQNPDAKYLSTSFWAGFFEEFQLSSVLFNNIQAEPGPDDHPNDEMVDALLEPRNDNPTQRIILKFIDWARYVQAEQICL